MKATGIVRRIDDLGRVVIPKEIRRTMRIREGDPLEIYTANEGEVILKKYSPIGELRKVAEEYATSAFSVLGSTVMITDTDHIIAVSGGPKKTFIDQKISKEVEKTIHSKTNFIAKSSENITHVILEDSDMSSYRSQVIMPIISQGDSIGSVILLSSSIEKPLADADLKAAEIGANFLARQMES